MAMKDWKKTVDKKGFIYFENTKTPETITLTKISKTKWGFFSTRIITKNKFFKTKSAALKFAKSYMKKH